MAVLYFSKFDILDHGSNFAFEPGRIFDGIGGAVMNPYFI